ncbi:hypothetical protein Belba_3597 [Belliella baltica DSM 15883]|jgi:hypothetical protein|uniref:Uncharacterized protein n=1 Tax=Belliella baltica (strain DSM 15883 / CIP 108006 / LMG 21964 / BA134) TaxID=866536 RepID=I3ZA23_BELBD|nr:hypothetical protein [Belliella baltica]AFL86091.1 hypothetical protein Belba_3597 [Belliella baltica DSM 15883]
MKLFLICLILILSSCNKENSNYRTVNSYIEKFKIPGEMKGLLIISEKYCGPCQESTINRIWELDCKEVVIIISGTTLSSNLKNELEKLSNNGFVVFHDKENMGERMGLPLAKPLYVEFDNQKVVNASNYENAIDLPLACI